MFSLQELPEINMSQPAFERHRCTDIVRATILYDDLADMYSGLELLEKLDKDMLQAQLLKDFSAVVSVHGKVVSFFSLSHFQ